MKYIKPYKNAFKIAGKIGLLIISIIVPLIYNNVFAQKTTSVKILRNEIRTHDSNIWKDEILNDATIKIVGQDDFKKMNVRIIEPPKDISLNLVMSSGSLTWKTNEGYIFVIGYYHGEDATGKKWLVELYIPRENTTDKTFLVLKSQDIVIKYMFKE